MIIDDACGTCTHNNKIEETPATELVTSPDDDDNDDDVKRPGGS